MNDSLAIWTKRIPLQMSFLITVTVAFLASKPALAANLTFSPSIEISEEFTDNIFEITNNKRSEFITRIQPGITSRYQAPFWNWDLAYNFDYRKYELKNRGEEYTHNGSLIGNLSLLDNFLFVDVSDTYHRVTLDVSRNAATESSLFINQTDQNTATIYPYLLWRLGESGTLRTGYRYTNFLYRGGGIARQEHSAIVDLNRQVSSKFSISTGYGFTHLESQPSGYNKHDLSCGFRFEFADKSFVSGQIGNSWQQFDNGADASYLFWNVGVTHDMGFTVASLETRVQTAADPLAVSTKETSYSGRLEKTLQRGMVGISTSYSEFVNTQTDSANQRKLAFTCTGRIEMLQNLNASLAITAERYYLNTGTGFPYHLNAISGLSYNFNHDLALSLSYTYDARRIDIDNAIGAIETNRVIVDVKKMFN